MNAKSLSILAAVAVLAAVVATMAVKNRDASVAGKLRSGRLFPELIQQVNDVTALEVTTADGSYRISRLDDGAWGLAEKDDYPVDFERVKKALVAIADLQIIEPKTSKPENFEKLGVQLPDAEGSTSKLVRLSGTGGEELAALVVGNPKNRGGLQSLYVRRAGEDQTWYVEGSVTLDADGAAWLDKQIVKVERDRIRSVDITHADGEAIVVAKNQPGDKTLELRDKPVDRELKYATVANGMASALEWCNLDDVQPAEGSTFPDPPHATAVFETFDGLVVRIDTYTDDEDKTFARFEASFDAAKRYEPQEEGEAGVADLAPPGDVEMEAEEINAKVGPWIYTIPQFNRSSFTKRLEELLAEPAPEEPVDDPGAVEPPGEEAPPTEDPAADPAGEDPNGQEPGSEEPGTEEPGETPAEEPETEEPAEETEEPSGSGGR